MLERPSGARSSVRLEGTTSPGRPGAAISRPDDPRVHPFCITYGLAGAGEALEARPAAAGASALPRALAVL